MDDWDSEEVWCEDCVWMGNLQEGKKKTVTIKNVKSSNISAVALKSSKKTVAAVQKKSKTSFLVQGVKKGTATVTAKITLKKAVNKKEEEE